MLPFHKAIITTNRTDKKKLISDLTTKGSAWQFSELENKNGKVYSKSTLDLFIEEEERHDRSLIINKDKQLLSSMSSGEQRKALLDHLLTQSPEYLILDNPFDHLDSKSVSEFSDRLLQLSSTISMILILSRMNDIPRFVHEVLLYSNGNLKKLSKKEFKDFRNNGTKEFLEGSIPPPIHEFTDIPDILVKFTKVSVNYSDRPVLNNINWEIKKGEFWQLLGPNGSGKTTLLNMITGDSIKGYGQDLSIFGHKKGSGESVWELKSKIGYFTPSITNHFERRHPAEHMILSGFYDSVGLYTKPSELQLSIAREWLLLLGLWNERNKAFVDLPQGSRRLIMIARAMVKHPPLLILDEPTTGLDDESSAMFVSLINKIARESSTAILYVSHRHEEGLQPEHIFALTPNKDGSEGMKIK